MRDLRAGHRYQGSRVFGPDEDDHVARRLLSERQVDVGQHWLSGNRFQNIREAVPETYKMRLDHVMEAFVGRVG